MQNKGWFYLDLAVNIIGPWAVYSLLAERLGETPALLWSMLPPLLWSAWELWREKRVDSLSVLVLVGIAFSVAVGMLGGRPEVLLMRESLLSGVIGIVFLSSLLWPKPVLFYLARATLGRRQAGGAAHFDALYAQNPMVRQGMRSMTLAWGVGTVGETVLRYMVLQYVSTATFLWFSPILGYLVMGGLMGWTVWYRLRLRRQVE